MSKKSLDKQETKVSNALSEIKEILKIEAEKCTTQDKKIFTLFQKLFVNETNKVKFPEIYRSKEKSKFNYIIHFIGLFSSVFKLSKEERNNLYHVNINQIEDKQIKNELQTLEKIKNIEIKEKMPNYIELYEIIEKFIKREQYTLFQYMEALILKMAYVIGKMNLLRYILFVYIDNIFIKNVLKEETQIIDYMDCQMDLTNIKCITLIKNLFDENNLQGEAFILALMIFRFNKTKELTLNYDIHKIKDVISRVNDKLLTTYDLNDSLFIETIFLLIEEELKNIDKKDEIHNIGSNLNNNNPFDNFQKISQPEENKNENKKISVKENINNNNISSSQENINNNNISSSQENINNNIIINIEKDIIGDKKINIKDLCNKILNMKESDKSELNLKDIKDSIRYLVCKINKIEEDNKKLNEDNKKMNEDNKKLNEDNKKLNEDNKRLNEDSRKLKLDNEQIKERLSIIENDVLKLKNQNYEIKSVLSDIQCRSQCKNLLKCFKPYLKDDDIARIQDNQEQKGDIISERIKKDFSNKCDINKINLMTNIIKKAADLYNRGNNYAHSLSIQYYKESIEKYKKEKNIRILDNVKIFCFLIGIKMEKSLFDETYAFLEKYFDSDLGAKSWKKGYIEDILK